MSQGLEVDVHTSEGLYNQVQETGRLLQQGTDDEGRKQLQDQLQDVQDHWLCIGTQLQVQREKLSSSLAQWDLIQDSIQDQQAWLRDMKLQLNADLPHYYDELQNQLQACKVC